jgi:hypothetical protein
MTETELRLQEQLVSVFEELNAEIKRLSSELGGLGYKQRSALVAHVDSGYTMHKELNEARTKWEKMSEVLNVQKWIFGLMRQYRDLWGYFDNYDEIREEIETVKSAAIKKEDYNIAAILTHWLNKLP